MAEIVLDPDFELPGLGSRWVLWERAGRVGAVYSCLEAASSSVPPFPTVTHEAESQPHEASTDRAPILNNLISVCCQGSTPRSDLRGDNKSDLVVEKSLITGKLLTRPDC